MRQVQGNRFSLFYFWIGCIVGGLILGVFIGKLTDDSKIVQAVEPDASSLPGVVSSSPVSKVLSVTLLFTGDVMLGRSVNQNMVEQQDPSWPFINVGETMKKSDITYINLESPFYSDCPLTKVGMKFCSDPGNIAGLVSSGVDVASIANNHSTNYGEQGLTETINTLYSNGIAPVGIGESATLIRNNQYFNFLSFNDVGRYNFISQADSESITNQISKAKSIGGLVIVTFHWGVEYQNQPSARQIELAHTAIDLGADLVIGSHPHWVQTTEIYKGKPIYYSLGNFVFDQEWSEETKRGLVVRFTYLNKELMKTEELPVFIQNYGQPEWQ